jgi:hypothetical protein
MPRKSPVFNRASPYQNEASHRGRAVCRSGQEGEAGNPTGLPMQPDAASEPSGDCGVPVPHKPVLIAVNRTNNYGTASEK